MLARCISWMADIFGKGGSVRWLLGVLSMAAAGCAVAFGGGGWSPARPVAGVSIQGQHAAYSALGYAGASCPSPRDCTVAYQPSGQGTRVFSVTRHDGVWGAPRQVPGLRAVPGEDLSLACVPAGECVLAADASDSLEVMVARLAHGAWSKARPVPGLAALRPGQRSFVSSLACGRTGWCALAGGTEPPGKYGRGQAFVASEHNGIWSRAQAVPGLAELTRGWATGAAVVSCDPRDSCTAAGVYGDHRGYEDKPYVVTDRAGRWGQAHPIAGTAPAAASGITALWCSAPGDCSAAGTSSTGGTGTLARLFTVAETGGTWHRAATLRGTIKLPSPADTQNITALTCTAPGQCTAVGAYGTSVNSVPVDAAPFTAAQVNGTWSRIHAIRGLPADAVARVTSLSCASAGNCAAGGYWLTNPGGDEHTLSSNHAFLVTETHGTWGQADRVPGLAAAHSRDSAIHVVSCQARRGCTSIGDYLAHDRHLFTSARG